MMDWVEFTAKTVNDALTEALIKLGTTSDRVEYTVIEKESNGIWGFFSKPARIKVRIKEEEKKEIEKIIIEEIVEGEKDKVLSEEVNTLTAEKIAKQFLEQVLKVMQIEAVIESTFQEEEKTICINISGSGMGVLIGKRGQTLDSLQYLTSLVVNKNTSSYLKVKLDTENYRERRKETLENLARNIAYKVKKTRHSVALEPMNPYERRIIHSALQYDKFVETHSEGEEPYRKVVITLKKGYRDYSKNINKSYKKDYYSYKKEHTIEKKTISEE